MTPPSPPVEQAAARLLASTAAQLYRRGMLAAHDEHACAKLDAPACISCLHDAAYRALTVIAEHDGGPAVAVGEPIASAFIVRVLGYLADTFPELVGSPVRHDRLADVVRGLLIVKAHQLRTQPGR